MCYNGFEPGDTESEREAALPFESEGDLPFLPDPMNEDWRLGEMTPEERMFRDMLEADDEEGSNDGPVPPQR